MPNMIRIDVLLARCQAEYLEIEFSCQMLNPEMQQADLTALLDRDSGYRALLVEEQSLLKIWKLEQTGIEADLEEGMFASPFDCREWDRRRKYSGKTQGSRSRKAKLIASRRSGNKQRRALKIGEGPLSYLLEHVSA